MAAVLEKELVSLEDAMSLVSTLTWDEKRQLVAEILRQMTEEKPEVVAVEEPADSTISKTIDPEGMWSDLPPITKEMLEESRREMLHGPQQYADHSGSR